MWCKPTLVSVKISIVFFNDQQNRASPCLAIVVHLFMTHYSYIFAIVCLVAPVTYVTILELYVLHIKLGYQCVVDINLQNDSFWHSLQQLITAFFIYNCCHKNAFNNWLAEFYCDTTDYWNVIPENIQRRHATKMALTKMYVALCCPWRNINQTTL